MPKQYTDAQILLQREFNTEALASRLGSTVARSEFTEGDTAFIGSQDMVFLATVDSAGQPTCSYKGGEPGFVRVVDPKTLQFPLYDGNGMFLSAGNVQDTARVGLLFINVDVPHRLRVDGTASLVRSEEALVQYSGALLVVEVAVTAVYVNCPRYIHKRKTAERSRYLPKPGAVQPFPHWKRLDIFNDVLSSEEQERVQEAGGKLSLEDYRALLSKGDA